MGAGKVEQTELAKELATAVGRAIEAIEPAQMVKRVGFSKTRLERLRKTLARYVEIGAAGLRHTLGREQPVGST